MSNTSVSNAGAQDMLNALVDRFETGTGTAKIEIRSAPQPARVDVAATGSVLATINLNTPTAFGNASDDAGNNRAQATADNSPVLQDTSADATTTANAAWYRGYEQGGAGLVDGDVGTGAGFDMNIDNVSIAPGQTVTVTSWNMFVNEEAP